MESNKIEVRVSNLDCEHDASSIERGLEGFPGLISLKVYPKSAKVALIINPDKTNFEVLKNKLGDLGFPPQKGMGMAEQPKPWRNLKVLTSVLSGIILLIGWLADLASISTAISTMVFIGAILIGGYYFGREAIEKLIFEHQVGIELLMLIAAITASAMGSPLNGAMLVFLYSISEAAEGYTEEKTRSTIKALMGL